jgi:hypothetical protein
MRDGREGVLLKADGAIYAPCACEDGDGLEGGEGRGGLELLGRELNLIDTYEEGIVRTVVHLDVFMQLVVETET